MVVLPEPIWTQANQVTLRASWWSWLLTLMHQSHSVCRIACASECYFLCWKWFSLCTRAQNSNYSTKTNEVVSLDPLFSRPLVTQYLFSDKLCVLFFLLGMHKQLHFSPWIPLQAIPILLIILKGSDQLIDRHGMLFLNESGAWIITWDMEGCPWRQERNSVPVAH